MTSTGDGAEESAQTLVVGDGADIESSSCENEGCRTLSQKLQCAEEELTKIYDSKNKTEASSSERRTRDGRALMLLKKKVREKDAKLDSLSKTLAEVQTLARKSGGKSAALSVELKASKAAAEKVAADLGEERAGNRAVASSLARASEANKALTATIAERESLLQAHEGELSALRESRAAVRAECDAALDRAGAAEALLSEMETQCAAARREAADLRAEMERRAQEAVLAKPPVVDASAQTGRSFALDELSRRSHAAFAAEQVLAAAQLAAADAGELAKALRESSAYGQNAAAQADPAALEGSSEVAALHHGAPDSGRNGAGASSHPAESVEAAAAARREAEATVVQLTRLNKELILEVQRLRAGRDAAEVRKLHASIEAMERHLAPAASPSPHPAGPRRPAPTELRGGVARAPKALPEGQPAVWHRPLLPGVAADAPERGDAAAHDRWFGDAGASEGLERCTHDASGRAEPLGARGEAGSERGGGPGQPGGARAAENGSKGASEAARAAVGGSPGTPASPASAGASEATPAGTPGEGGAAPPGSPFDILYSPGDARDAPLLLRSPRGDGGSPADPRGLLPPEDESAPERRAGLASRLGVGRLGARLLVEWEAAAGSDSDSSPALARGAGRGARSPPAGIPESPPPSAERAGEDASLSGASLFEVLQSRLKNSAARRGALRPGGSLTGLAALPAGRAPCAPPPPLPAAASPGECAAARPGKTQRALHHPRSRDARESRGGPDEKPHGVRVALPAPDDFLLA